MAGQSRRLLHLTLAVLALGAAAALLVWRPWRREEVDVVAVIAAGERPAPSVERPPTAQPGRPPDAAALATLMRDTSWRVRLSAANSLGARADIPPERRAELLLEALAREVARPTGAAPLPGSYVPMTSLIRLQYLRVIGDLGTGATAVARASIRRTTGEAREWAILALGEAGAREAVPQLREVLRTSRHGEVRMTAARLLGALQAREAIPELRAALTDPFTATVSSDAHGGPRSPFYPVRGQAASALKKLGLTVERRGHTFTVVP
jgi:HEAT repeat protein